MKHLDRFIFKIFYSTMIYYEFKNKKIEFGQLLTIKIQFHTKAIQI